MDLINKNELPSADEYKIESESESSESWVMKKQRKRSLEKLKLKKKCNERETKGVPKLLNEQHEKVRNITNNIQSKIGKAAVIDQTTNSVNKKENKEKGETAINETLDEAKISPKVLERLNLAREKKNKIQNGDYDGIDQLNICKDFYKSGYCAFGDACIHIHIRPSLAGK